jgi:hypothetical protein
MYYSFPIFARLALGKRTTVGVAVRGRARWQAAFRYVGELLKRFTKLEQEGSK